MTSWTTFFEGVRARWRRTAPVSEPSAPIFRIERAKSRVPNEYGSLYTYLEHRYASTVVLTFGQMEALLGFALPPPACTDREWWTGGSVRTNRYSEAWL